MEISNLSHSEFKTLFVRMLKELSEGLSSIKKDQSEMKDTKCPHYPKHSIYSTQSLSKYQWHIS